MDILARMRIFEFIDELTTKAINCKWVCNSNLVPIIIAEIKKDTDINAELKILAGMIACDKDQPIKCLDNARDYFDKHRDQNYFEKSGVFEKVSFEIFKEAYLKCNNLPDSYNDFFTRQIYDAIILPERKTTGSGGHDFHTPAGFNLSYGKSIMIPTGIRCLMRHDYVLEVYPRSGLGIKYRCQLDNTVGVIDSDFYFSDNQGHIMFKLTNDSKENKLMMLNQGDGFCQGIFKKFGVADTKKITGSRNGGHGSTTAK